MWAIFLDDFRPKGLKCRDGLVSCSCTLIQSIERRMIELWPENHAENPILSDSSLTLPNVLAAFRTVHDVETLEGVLEVPDAKAEEVERQSASYKERREGLVKYFLQTHPNASWEWLGGRLLWWEKNAAAVQSVKVHIKPNEGEYDYVVLYSNGLIMSAVGVPPC